MNEPQAFDWRRSLSVALLLVCAFAVPWWSLAIPGFRRALPLETIPVVIPFGWMEVVVIHILAGVPLALLLAFWLTRAARFRTPLATWLLVLTAILVAWLGMKAVPIMASQCEGKVFLLRAFIRGLWSFALVFPWCLAVCSRLPTPANWRFTSAVNLVMALVIFSVLPLLYETHLIEQKTTRFDQLVRQQRLLQAYLELTRLVEIGSPTRVELDPTRMRRDARRLKEAVALLQEELGRSPTSDELAKQLETHPNVLRALFASFDPQPPSVVWGLMRQDMLRFEAASAEPLPAAAPIQQRLERAEALLSYDEFAEATKVLGDLPKHYPVAALLSGRIEQFAGRPAEGVKQFQQAARLLESLDSSDPAMMDLYCEAVIGIAENERTLREYQQAEQVMLLGLERVASRSQVAARRLHLELGKHYQMGGRPLRAVKHLDEARKEPTLTAKADEVLEVLRRQTPLCLLRP